jgi:hypothetical protein
MLALPDMATGQATYSKMFCLHGRFLASRTKRRAPFHSRPRGLLVVSFPWFSLGRKALFRLPPPPTHAGDLCFLRRKHSRGFRDEGPGGQGAAGLATPRWPCAPALTVALWTERRTYVHYVYSRGGTVLAFDLWSRETRWPTSNWRRAHTWYLFIPPWRSSFISSAGSSSRTGS